MRPRLASLAFLLSGLGFSLSTQNAIPPAPPSTASQPETTTVNPAQGAVWDLIVLYRDAAAVEPESADLLRKLPSLGAFKGHLGDDAGAIRKALDRHSAHVERVRKMRRYASMKVYEDARAQFSQALAAATAELIDDLGAQSAFFDPRDPGHFLVDKKHVCEDYPVSLPRSWLILTAIVPQAPAREALV